MTPEEREQLLRDVETIKFFSEHTFPDSRGELIEAAQRLAAFAREQLAKEPVGDDGDPVTEEWLRSIGVCMEDDDEDALGISFSPGRCAECYFGVVRFAGDWQAILSEGDEPQQVYLGDMKTRGDVRRLAKALGIPLTPRG